MANKLEFSIQGYLMRQSVRSGFAASSPAGSSRGGGELLLMLQLMFIIIRNNKGPNLLKQWLLTRKTFPTSYSAVRPAHSSVKGHAAAPRNIHDAVVPGRRGDGDCKGPKVATLNSLHSFNFQIRRVNQELQRIFSL